MRQKNTLFFGEKSQKSTNNMKKSLFRAGASKENFYLCKNETKTAKKHVLIAPI